MLYGMGMLELGVAFSYAQLMVDNEIAGIVKRIVRGTNITDATMAVDLIRKIGGGQGKHYLMEDHTMEYLKSEQHEVHLFDRQTRENWIAAGSKNCTIRAEELAREIFHSHKPEPLDKAVLNEFQRIIDDAEK